MRQDKHQSSCSPQTHTLKDKVGTVSCNLSVSLMFCEELWAFALIRHLASHCDANYIFPRLERVRGEKPADLRSSQQPGSVWLTAFPHKGRPCWLSLDRAPVFIVAAQRCLRLSNVAGAWKLSNWLGAAIRPDTSGTLYMQVFVHVDILCVWTCVF